MEEIAEEIEKMSKDPKFSRMDIRLVGETKMSKIPIDVKALLYKDKSTEEIFIIVEKYHKSPYVNFNGATLKERGHDLKVANSWVLGEEYLRILGNLHDLRSSHSVYPALTVKKPVRRIGKYTFKSKKII